jgi:hypothetical protein
MPCKNRSELTADTVKRVLTLSLILLIRLQKNKYDDQPVCFASTGSEIRFYCFKEQDRRRRVLHIAPEMMTVEEIPWIPKPSDILLFLHQHLGLSKC